MDDQVVGASGNIKCYFPIKGYGFIRREKGKDVFFLRTDAQSEDFLHDGAMVVFDLRIDEKGPRALRIRRVA